MSGSGQLSTDAVFLLSLYLVNVVNVEEEEEEWSLIKQTINQAAKHVGKRMKNKTREGQKGI